MCPSAARLPEAAHRNVSGRADERHSRMGEGRKARCRLARGAAESGPGRGWRAGQDAETVIEPRMPAARWPGSVQENT